MSEAAPGPIRPSGWSLTLGQRQWLQDTLPQAALVLVLVIAAALRFSGIEWDDQTHLHPDERFLTMVETNIQFPQDGIGYFDTASSPLNPNNVGHGFFVYGTLPIFLVRLLGAWLEATGYDQIHLVGRAAAAAFDLLSVYLIFLIGRRLYSPRVGILAAAFTAFSALLVQHAHFFVVDPFANTFILAAFYFAVRSMDSGKLADYVFFGLTLGMSVASKINAAPLAGVLALAAGVYIWRAEPERRSAEFSRAIVQLAVAAVISLLTFRVLQPYAFKGPSFFNFALNPNWLTNMREVAALTGGGVDAPFALQWADRIPLWFSFKNLVLWGMGWPLGLLAWGGWAWAAYRMTRGEWQRHLLPVFWTGAYFLWRGIGFTAAMRYQMPIYPTLALMAAWAVWFAWERAGQIPARWRMAGRWAVGTLGSAVLLATLAYAIALARNYTLPMTRVEASRWIYQNVPGPLNLVLQTGDQEVLEPIALPSDLELGIGNPYARGLHAEISGQAQGFYLPDVRNLGTSQLVLKALLLDDTRDQAVVAEASFAGEPSTPEMKLAFPQPVSLNPEHAYSVRLEVQQGGPVGLLGATLVSESGWDDALPVRIDERDGFGGLYQGADQELYWPDDEDKETNGVSDKLERIVDTLERGDFLVITSNRQYGTIARVPQRYPLTTAYYRALFDCPAPEEVARCADGADPGELEPILGYELVASFQRDPTLGPLRWRDQAAEEAFTVYDHPKVLIFRKRPDFSAERVRALLEGIDLSGVINAPPNELGSPPKDLLLPQARVQQQRSGGTWSELFSRQSLINRWQPVTVVGWWLAIGLIGLLAFPLVRAGFGGLRDAGYPLARLVGLLFIAWASWLAGSVGIGYTRGTILLALLVLAALSAAFAWRDREGLAAYFKERRREVLWTEGLILAFFLFDLAIRFGNPDLWHRYLGGEKPMDFAYLNAVIKSTSFPPFDPWYAGGYINYYYFGFVLVGTPVKLLGVVPSVAYNLILPTLFSLAAGEAYCVGYNLLARLGEAYAAARRVTPRLAGAAAALLLVVMGNLGTARMIYDGLKEMGAPEASNPEEDSFGPLEAMRGLGRLVTLNGQMPYALHHWYWNPSRAIPAPDGETGPITEFPFFTFLYADLHAHMIALPITVAALGWALSMLMGSDVRRRRRFPQWAAGLFLGALILGSLGPTNTWDFPVYWVLGAAATATAVVLARGRTSAGSLVEAGITAGLVLVAAQLLYRPYYAWYGQGYTRPDLWTGSRTPLDAYLTVHGLFLYLIVPWLAWETRQWMAATPLSALGRLRPRFGSIVLIAGLWLAFMAYLSGIGYSIAPLVSVLVYWPGLLLLRRELPIEKRAALVMIASAAALTFVVEVLVLRGDIARMNTVFKFYMQVWTLFSLASAGALVWLLADLPRWGIRTRQIWAGGLALLAFAAALYPATATGAKVRDRMTVDAPHTLEGAAFMRSATYDDLGQSLSLEDDYQAIQWAQENIQGSPVIVEAQIPEYRWGSRFAIYTGLPAVLGWNWHQRQQRAAVADLDVTQRSQEITDFYLTPSTEAAQRFLDRYAVRYVIVGGLERLYYAELDQCADLGSGAGVSCSLDGRLVGFATLEVPADRCTPNGSNGMLNCPTGGLDKFERMVDQGLMRAVYRSGNTIIYEVAS